MDYTVLYMMYSDLLNVDFPNGLDTSKCQMFKPQKLTQQ